MALKGLTTTVRFKSTDIVDVWRCLEICLAARVDRADLDHGVRAQSAEIIRELFRRRDGSGMRALISEQHLSPDAADQQLIRIRALIARVLGSGPRRT